MKTQSGFLMTLAASSAILPSSDGFVSTIPVAQHSKASVQRQHPYAVNSISLFGIRKDDQGPHRLERIEKPSQVSQRSAKDSSSLKKILPQGQCANTTLSPLSSAFCEISLVENPKNPIAQIYGNVTSYSKAIELLLEHWGEPQVLDNIPTQFLKDKVNEAIKSLVKQGLALMGSLALRPSQYLLICQTIHKLHKIGIVPPMERVQPPLKSSFNFDVPFDLKGFDRPKSSFKTLLPTIALGWPINAKTPNAQAKKNTMLAAVLHQLHLNALDPNQPEFTAIYNNESFGSVADFLTALIKDGHQITAQIELRPADFLGIFSKDISQSQGYRPVPHSFFVRTGIADQGQEALVAATHAQVNFQITLDPNSQTPQQDLSGAFSWVNDIKAGSHYRPHEVIELQAWEVSSFPNQFSGQQAIEVARWSELISNVNHQLAQDNGLLGDGYGPGGMCLDAAALIQQLMTGQVSFYPLVLDKSLYGETIEKIQAQVLTQYQAAQGKDRVALKRLMTELSQLRAAVKDFPSDVKSDAPNLQSSYKNPFQNGNKNRYKNSFESDSKNGFRNSIKRCLASNPWSEEHPSPFKVVRQGQSILSKALEKNNTLE